MRPRSFWTPRYVTARAVDKLYRRRHPDHPWLTPEAVAFLEGWLRPTDKIMEFGAGRSTTWLAARAASVLSLEAHREWENRVMETARRLNLSDRVQILSGPNTDGYLDALGPHDAETFDLVLVDGIRRSVTADWALRHVKPGGVIVVDNAERYLPSDSRSPFAMRRPAAGWESYDGTVSTWRRYWTTNGVSDTAFFFAPTGREE